MVDGLSTKIEMNEMKMAHKNKAIIDNIRMKEAASKGKKTVVAILHVEYFHKTK